MADEFVLIKNNGLGNIHQKNIPNCCIFIALGTVWQHVDKKDFDFHFEIFQKHLERPVTPEEMVYSIVKVKHPDVVAGLGQQQIDTIIEKFVDYTKFKLSVVLAENGMKWDLFPSTSSPDAIIVQYPNHYECAINKKFLS